MFFQAEDGFVKEAAVALREKKGSKYSKDYIEGWMEF